jgi:hypothetical protein
VLKDKLILYIHRMSFSELYNNSILKTFPKFELSYENITHKKVYNADILLAIPEGNKGFAWFTCYNSENICFLLEIDEKNKIKTIKRLFVSFIDSLALALGTIFYGSLFTYNNISCFAIEDIYYYKGNNYINTPYSNKLYLLKQIFNTEISQNILNHNFTIFGLPLVYMDFNLLLNDIQKLPYKISQIKFRFFEKKNARKIVTMKYFKPSMVSKNNIQNEKQTAVFKIMAGIEPDIYNLFIYKNGVDEYYDIAFIPDFKTSVMMNKLFRNIKENANLDLLEESDNEDEFENEKEDRFVYLDREFNMLCSYNYKFKKWVPIKIADDNSKIISLEKVSFC